MYKFDKDLVDAYGMNGKRKMRITAFLEMGISLSKIDQSSLISETKLPALLLYGREDKIASGKQARLMSNKKITVEDISYAGHMVFWEKSEDVANRINKFTQVKATVHANGH